MTYEEIIHTIKKSGYKLTPQRKAIVQILSDKRSTLISADSILKGAKNLCEKTNMSTVYRNLELLQELGLLYIVNTDGTTLYKLVCAHHGHHHHLICKSCGKTEVIEFCPMEFIDELTAEKEFSITEHKLELYGQCKECSRKKPHS